MHDQFKAVYQELIRATLANPDANETTITEVAALGLKKRKFGLFQNDVDYRLLLPDFLPPEGVGLSTRNFRANLVGYTRHGFVLLEYRIYDELLRHNKNPWGILYYFDLDRKKLESAIEANAVKHQGIVCSVFAVRNTDFEEHPAQVSTMVESWGMPGRNPPIKNSRYYPILHAMKGASAKLSKYGWHYELVKKDRIAFLVGTASLI